MEHLLSVRHYAGHWRPKTDTELMAEEETSNICSLHMSLSLPPSSSMTVYLSFHATSMLRAARTSHHRGGDWTSSALGHRDTLSSCLWCSLPGGEGVSLILILIVVRSKGVIERCGPRGCCQKGLGALGLPQTDCRSPQASDCSQGGMAKA